MKRNILYLSVFILLACEQVYFATPQPLKGTKIKSFISEIQGNYVDSTLDVSVLNDALVIAHDTFHLTTQTPVEGQVSVRFHKNFYFVSIPDSSFFSVYMANFYENKLAIYMLNADERSIDILNRFVSVDTLNAKEEHYLINPGKKEFDQLVDNDLFNVVSVLEKVD
jgi:hypothetical protein